MNHKGTIITQAMVNDLITKKDRVVVLYGSNVLDVTDFDHPGPESAISESIGKDIKKSFESTGHS